MRAQFRCQRISRVAQSGSQRAPNMAPVPCSLPLTRTCLEFMVIDNILAHCYGSTEHPEPFLGIPSALPVSCDNASKIACNCPRHRVQILCLGFADVPAPMPYSLGSKRHCFIYFYQWSARSYCPPQYLRSLCWLYILRCIVIILRLSFLQHISVYLDIK